MREVIELMMQSVAEARDERREQRATRTPRRPRHPRRSTYVRPSVISRATQTMRLAH